MLDRLSPQDASNLRVEARGSGMHIAGLAIVEGAPLRTATGRLRLDDLRTHVERRLHLAPRLRQILYRPAGLGLGRPVWVDDRRFDISHHVRSRSVPGPGDEAALLAAVEELIEPSLDRSRPLWELWLLTDLAGGRVALLIRLHHVVADGIAALALLGSLFDLSPEAPSPAPLPWNPAPEPSSDELLRDNLQRRVAAAERGISRLGRPQYWWPRTVMIAAPVLSALRDGLAPRTPFNGPIGSARRLHLARADLEQVKAAAHAHGAKLNDVVLAAIAAAARGLMARRTESVRSVTLRAMVPVSLRESEDPSAGGNLLAMIIVPLPLGSADPIRSLEHIARTTAERKRRPFAQWGRFPSLLAGVMNHQRFVNVFTSNIPGPVAPVYFAGAKVLEIFQIGPVQGNVRLSVGVFSYAGVLHFDVVSDADSLPDVDAFAEELQRALDEMTGAGV